MSEVAHDLLALAGQLDGLQRRFVAHPRFKDIKTLLAAATRVGLAHSGSWIGYQALVYYSGFQAPPASAHFSSEWGFGNRTVGTWERFTFDNVQAVILNLAELSLPLLVEEEAIQTRQQYLALRDELNSLFETVMITAPDDYLRHQKHELQPVAIYDREGLLRLRQRRPPPNRTRDSRAAEGGIVVPPHVAIAVYAEQFDQIDGALRVTAGICRNVSKHIQRKERSNVKESSQGNKIFIGHGQSSVWKDLKDFLSERLKLEYDEFNRVPVAGVPTGVRLQEMLDHARFAFVIMTAENETADARVQARMNVIHEVGLFQGRLGMTRAIVLLEEGCEEFSNIQGLGQIRFPAGNIKATFEEIRRVLEREQVL